MLLLRQLALSRLPSDTPHSMVGKARSHIRGVLRTGLLKGLGRGFNALAATPKDIYLPILSYTLARVPPPASAGASGVHTAATTIQVG